MSVIFKPIITEKATINAEENSVYSFYVDPRANKIQIKHAIEEVYNVDVVKVRTLIVRPVVKSKYTKKGLQVGKSNKMKKAIVSVGEGQIIDLYDNI